MGYCCCRVFGFYFSGEAVLVFFIVICYFFYIYNSGYSSYFPAFFGFDVWLQMSNRPSPVKTFFVRVDYHARPVPRFIKPFINRLLYYLTVTSSVQSPAKC